MKKCPYCAEEIQDEAVKCKHCGTILDKDLKSFRLSKRSEDGNRKAEHPREGLFLQSMNCGCLVLLLIIVFVIIAVAVSV